VLRSPAKLNLGLRIIGRRPDGYHLLESLFWPINFCDEIEISSSDSLKVESVWAPTAPFQTEALYQNEQNLVGRVLEGNRNWSPPHKYKVAVSKNIPTGAGLGGGSSNAGTVLSWLIKRKEITKELATEVAVRIGADIPFFLEPSPTWVQGIGEKRTVLSVESDLENQIFFLLVLFPFSTSTPTIFGSFRSLDVPFSPPSHFKTEQPLTFRTLTEYLRTTQNDLQPLVASGSEPIAKALDSLKLTDCLYSGLSGSGSTCFAIYSSQEKRKKVAKEFESFCRIYSCKTVFAETF
jgi:4-diphosphocytidyl-2-C-methyl-D-erythritol kinase